MQSERTKLLTTDAKVFEALPGGLELIEWFGFVPSFHDATLASLEIVSSSATLRIAAFRMTRDVDEKGFFVTDRHTLVTINFSGVSGVSLVGAAESIFGEICIRRLTEDAENAHEWANSVGPKAGDYEVSWDASYGLCGSVFARSIELSHAPLEPLPILP